MNQIKLEKMNISRALLDEYSFMAHPYNYHYFHNMDKLGFQVDWVGKSDSVSILGNQDRNFSLEYTFNGNRYSLDEYLERNSASGFLVLHDNKIIYEQYLNGADQNSRFISYSVGKSITAILTFAAIEDGKIESVDDLVIKYLPYLSESGYRKVTIKNLLQMSSGIKWDEISADGSITVTNDLSEFCTAWLTGKPTFNEIAISVKTKELPGQKFEYQSLNYVVLGLIIEQVTGMPLNEYTAQKIWAKIGTQSDAYYVRGKNQPNICASGTINATLRDFGRFGLMVLNGGELKGTQVISKSWLQASGHPDQDFLRPKPYSSDKLCESMGYNYGWWLLDSSDEILCALGAYGQCIYINRKRNIVIVQSSAWPIIDSLELWDEMLRVMEDIAHTISP